jgi:hypothetical protein
MSSSTPITSSTPSSCRTIQQTSAGIADVRDRFVVGYGVEKPAEKAPLFAIDISTLLVQLPTVTKGPAKAPTLQVSPGRVLSLYQTALRTNNQQRPTSL